MTGLADENQIVLMSLAWDFTLWTLCDTSVVSQVEIQNVHSTPST